MTTAAKSDAFTAPAGAPPGGKTPPPVAKPILDSFEHQMLRYRLRKMKSKKRIVDAIKLAAFWTRIRTFDRCKAMISAKQRWFAAKCFDDIVENTLKKLLDPSKKMFDSKYVEWSEELAQFEVESRMNSQDAAA